MKLLRGTCSLYYTETLSLSALTLATPRNSKRSKVNKPANLRQMLPTRSDEVGHPSLSAPRRGIKYKNTINIQGVLQILPRLTQGGGLVNEGGDRRGGQGYPD